MANGGVLVRVDYDLVVRTVEAKLEREGFIYDTPERRRMVETRAGPKPMAGVNVQLVSAEDRMAA